MKIKSPGTWKYNVVYALLAGSLVALGARHVVLLRDERGRALAMAERQQRMIIPLPGRPGSIYARTFNRYVLLAGSKQVPGVFADPTMMPDARIGDVAIRAGDLLNEDPVRIQENLIEHRDNRFTRIKEAISPEQYQAIRSARLPGIGILYDWQREYPNGPLGAQVLGYRQYDGAPGEGLELSQDVHLSARNGQRVVLTDARRRAIWPVLSQSKLPQDGRNVYLCMDLIIQGYLEQALTEAVEKYGGRKTWATGLVVNPNTGEVLAMASWPSYDPREFNHTDANFRTNRSIVMPFEPGSAFKPIVAAAALDADLVNWQTQVNCESGEYLARNGGRITDHGSRYGMLTVWDVIVFSSNIGMAKIGEKLGNRALCETVYRFGFGERTMIELPGESPGIIRPLRQWDGYSLRRVPFGQEISVTALQLIMGYGALANGGELLRPRVIDSITDASGKELYRGERTVVRRAIGKKVSDAMRLCMMDVVERGTAKLARSDRWTIFGKTGTAQISGGPRGYVDGAYVSTFVGGAPVDNPEAICLISVYWPEKSKGYYGGKVAAPYVKDVLEKTLSYWTVPPDRSPGVITAGRGAPVDRRTTGSGW
jgi:cell division protein FtsI/penicillin-binding protein 2